MVNLEVIKENRYHSQKNHISKNERIYEDANGFRLTFYVNGLDIFAYYMGRYYLTTLEESQILEEIDILNYILEQCCDPYKVKEVDIEVD